MISSGAVYVAQAREAYARRDWADALEALKRADALQPLIPEDLERQAWTAGMLDRDAELFAACDRLYSAYLQAGRGDRAAYWAFFHGLRLLALKEVGQGSAWLQKARKLVESRATECAACGYLLLPEIQAALMADDCTRAAGLARDAVEVGERCADPDLISFAKSALGRSLIRRGRVEEGLAALDGAMLPAIGGELTPIVTGLVYCQLIATCRQVYAFGRAREWTEALDQWCGAQPQLVQFNGLCRVHRAELLELSGAWADALMEAGRAANSTARAIADETTASAAYQEAEIRRLRGEFELAAGSYRKASDLGLDPQPGLALLRLAQGHGEQAAQSMRRALAGSMDPLSQARLLPAAVEILIGVGAIEEARKAWERLEEIASRFGSEIMTAMASQARGMLALAGGDPATALRLLRAAFVVWREVGAPYIEARLRLLTALACRALGDEDGAQLELEAAGAIFRSLGARPDAARVAELVSSPTRGPHKVLTSREIEVLTRIAEGKINRVIASELGLSQKTVDRHVSNIFDKLAVSSRAAATAVALQGGLLKPDHG